MSPESAAVLVSWDGSVFFDLWGTFVTGLTALGAKMSSLKNRRVDKILHYTLTVYKGNFC